MSVHAAPKGFRVELATWPYGPECIFCGEPLKPKELGVFGALKEHPAEDDDEYEESHVWHLECARGLSQLLAKIVAEGEKALARKKR